MTTPNVNAPPASAAPTQNQDRLKTFFAGHNEDLHPSRWDALWQAGDFLPWDRGFANPALIDTLKSKPDWLPKATGTGGKRKRVLVPGCGKGYDLALFAAYGYDAYGIEISANALVAAESWLKDPGEGKEGEHRVQDESVGRGDAKVLLGDFFEDDDGWLQGAGSLGDGFDVVYDCTFLSALAPSVRPAWASRMSQLLAPDGVLICLEFPTHKPAKSGGPPWSLPSVVYQELFKRPGEEIRYDEEGKLVPEEKQESEDALVRIAYWKPTRTHQVGIINGEVKDWVSVWKHK
ncbi:S-adenosyl-L-methionine-dependent methyltransferase [Lophiostoma macrostomum CBS 122681]|uniref:S-adenosyl-L-methionine-dependent methyltransferase n=1 Tax=Lophiostoma macrostomum CBS 122681 TaxID=1314788 RepID=A0A6A6T3G9_9PLEO|nr:S-adenosyl-L-methionine-dependent methyltransferase [Lophiostoma macrostomum CBS 122681]